MTDSNIGHFGWYDLLTSDPDAAASYYAHVIGWNVQPWENGYTMFASEQGPLSGTTRLTDEARKRGAPPHWTSNVGVADVDATVAQAEKLGGRILAAATDYPKVGRLAVIADPQGVAINVFNAHQPTPARDPSRAGEFVWSELVTTDHEAAFRFHGTLFGWEKIRDFDLGPMGKYLIYGLGGKELGGMFTQSKAVTPPMWLYYVRVADLDAALKRATSMGGRVINGPMQVPGGARIAQLTDPQGAAFALLEDPRNATP